jgi:glyoxylase-like metal-dependent hydrolase (beta-lactamase superfamily II)
MVFNVNFGFVLHLRLSIFHTKTNKVKMNTRRLLNVYAFVTAFTAIGSIVPSVAQAAAPMVKQAAPGFYRMMLGDFEVTALSDGTVALPMDKLLLNTNPAKVDQILAKSYLKSPLETSVNAFLINTGDKLVLIDSGAGNLFGPTLGKLISSLKAAGYQPEQVDDILLTHMHPDHIGGLANNGKLVFPNAIIHADKQEADYWLSQDNMNKASDDTKKRFQEAMDSVLPYAKAGKLKTFGDNDNILPGIKVLSDHGHTPGHSKYLVESKGQKMLVWGDLVHVAAVQFAQPDVAIQFDSNPKAAIAARKKIFADAATQGYWIAGAHLPFPGIGHVRKEGKAYAWVPVNYSTVLP